MKRTADISDCGRYRYTLTREWDQSRARVLFIMLNPSTADATVDDPTIRRCMGFACGWGFGSLEVVNLSPIRSSDPEEVLRHRTQDDARAYHHNRWTIISAAERAGLIIYAWGAHKAIEKHHLAWYLFDTSNTRNGYRRDHLYAKARVLGTTKTGAPRHPLYLRRDAVPIEWAA